MIQSKLLDFWRSLHTNEKRIIKIILFSFPLIIVSIYLGEISKKISVKRLSLVVAQNNFDYVYDKALNFQQYSLAQKALSEYPQKRDFIFSWCMNYSSNNSIHTTTYQKGSTITSRKCCGWLRNTTFCSSYFCCVTRQKLIHCLTSG